MKLVIFCLLVFFLAIHVEAQAGDRRIDEEETYWEYQEIRKALDNSDKKSWMFYRTLRTTNRAKNKCVYAEVKGKKEGEDFYEFVQGYINGEEAKVEETLFAFPYKTGSTGLKDRENDNAMLVTKKKEIKTGRNYSLIYSDYQCCDILRSLADENGAACELYLHDHCVSEAVSRKCELQYEKACGKGDAYKHKVYYPSCRNTTDVTPKPTTKAPDHEETPENPTPEVPQTPEETTTTSTLPPGC